MSRSPFWNAAAAAGYIVIIASFLFYGPKAMGGQGEDTVLIPIAMLSLFVLSAAVMGYLFIYQPVIMYLEGEKQSAIKLFMQTLGTFAAITVVFLSVALLASR